MRLPLFVSRTAFHIARVCRMHTCFVFVALVPLFVLVCLCLRVIVDAFAVVCCKVAFQITRVCRLRVCFVLLSLVCSFVVV